MSELIGFEVREFGAARLIGREVAHSLNAGAVNPVPGLWQNMQQDGTLESLKNMPERITPEPDLVGWMGDYDPATSVFAYVAGVLTRPDTPVPAGYVFRDIPACRMGIGWIRGSHEGLDLYMGAHDQTAKAMQEHGLEHDDSVGSFEMEYYSEEKFSAPMGRGEKVLVMGYYSPCRKEANEPCRPVYPGADETTPSRAQYFSWINNTNEGATEAQTTANLAFFRYLREEYGMAMDIYAFDAGAVDGAKFYGSTDSERFRRQFPRGFAPVYEAARAIGTRLGIWGGPDGFGETPEEARKRIEMMAGFCRDFEFALFKFDAVCGQLPEEKRRYFVEMMTECRRHSSDLILLNHRLDLGEEGLRHATTFLWEGAETCIDVHMTNRTPATHNRACALGRGLPPDLKRLCEDHGVCLSSCLDYWEDDLVLQAFNRCLILAPEIYGNPWLLRDDELPKLARIYNLHRRFREILVNGMRLSEERFGPSAVARGDGTTRLVTLRNLTWEPVRYAVPLDSTIGLTGGGGERAAVEVRRLHPHERVLGRFGHGATVEVEVLPFRACLIVASTVGIGEIAVTGCDYDVVRDVPGRPVVIDLLAPAGTEAEVAIECVSPIPRANVSWHNPPDCDAKQPDVPWHNPPDCDARQPDLPWHNPPDCDAKQPGVSWHNPPDCDVRQPDLPWHNPPDCDVTQSGGLCHDSVPTAGFSSAALDGEPLVLPAQGGTVRVAFAGTLARAPWHRKLADLAPVAIPDDAEALYEATCFAADNNALEARELERSGPTAIPEVQAARDAFFQQPLFRQRHLWDRYLFDDDPDTAFALSRRWPGAGDLRIRGGELRVDFGEAVEMDRLVLEVGHEQFLQPFKSQEGARGWVSTDLHHWASVSGFVSGNIEMTMPAGRPVRYFRLSGSPELVRHVRGYYRGRALDRSRWRASNLFAAYHMAPATHAWSARFTLDEVAPGAYLALAIHGEHGNELAYAGVRTPTGYLGAPRRAPSFRSNSWECPVRQTPGNTTYFFPLGPGLAGLPMEAFVLLLKGGNPDIRPELWVTAYPVPFERRRLVLQRPD